MIRYTDTDKKICAIFIQMKKIDRNDCEVIELDRGQPWARRIHLPEEDAPSVIIFRLSDTTLIIPCALEIIFVYIGWLVYAPHDKKDSTK